MQLIADSGSTKVDWAGIYEDRTVKRLTTEGINPLFQTEDQIVYSLEKSLLPIFASRIDKVFFYGAGVLSAEKAQLLERAFLLLFPKAKFFVGSDMLAAARSLCGNKAGIACILGTGSNSCFYDGAAIRENIPAGGFILGDEGSGAVLGRKLISDWLKKVLPKDVEERVNNRYSLTYKEIVERVYKEPFPNRYLASFSPFINENRRHPYFDKMLKGSFREFFARNIFNYDCRNYAVNFVGSVAFHFQDFIRDVAQEQNIIVDKIELSPIDGLIDYHKLRML